METYNVVVIGGGPAGLAAALTARENGAEKVCIIERDFRLGGILEQCIHTGFGLKRFGEELSGPEYVDRFIKKIEHSDIDVRLNTMVLDIDSANMIIHAVCPGQLEEIKADAIVLSMGCRERTRFQVMLPGSRPAGIYSAGSAQRFINIQNYRVGKEIVILGSGDIGMIMARRMTLEGAHVKAVVEIMPYLSGLTRNRVQCLDDFGIPLYLSHTITNVRGNDRLTGVSVAKVDDRRNPIPGTEFDIDCDTLLCSVGLVPENELSKKCGVILDPVTKGPVVDSSMQTNLPGIFACGNVVHVNDLVDNVSEESEKAGKFAAQYSLSEKNSRKTGRFIPGRNVRYLVPQYISDNDNSDTIKASFRVLNPEKDVFISVKIGDTEISRQKRIKVNPGEIESVEVKYSLYREHSGKNITVSIEEA